MGKRKQKFEVINGNNAAQIKLEALNERQDQYINAVKNNSVVLCIGVWGSAKTYIPTVIASEMLTKKQIEKIIIARPAEGKGKSIGFLKGSAQEKLEPWCAPITDTIKKCIGRGQFEAMLANGKIEMLALEHVKGRSWDNSFIIVDECEDLDMEVAKSLVGRQGINSKIVITGDIAQKDIKKHSGLEYLIDVIRHSELDVPVINFDKWEYCVRSPEAKMWGQAFERFERR